MAMNLVPPRYQYHLQMIFLQWTCIKARTQTTQLALILVSIKSVRGYEEQNQINAEEKICNKRKTVQKIQTPEK